LHEHSSRLHDDGQAHQGSSPACARRAHTEPHTDKAPTSMPADPTEHLPREQRPARPPPSPHGRQSSVKCSSSSPFGVKVAK
jgi:hypothetical protein